MGHRKDKIIGDLTREIILNEPIKEVSFDKILMPIIKCPCPSISAHEFLSCQPMNTPTSIMFYKDFNRNIWYRRLCRWIKKLCGIKTIIRH